MWIQSGRKERENNEKGFCVNMNTLTIDFIIWQTPVESICHTIILAWLLYIVDPHVLLDFCFLHFVRMKI